MISFCGVALVDAGNISNTLAIGENLMQYKPYCIDPKPLLKILRPSRFAQEVKQILPNAHGLAIHQNIIAWCWFTPCVRQTVVARIGRRAE